MKAKKKAAATRRYHISLLVFLLALGLVPASLSNSNASAEAENVTEHATDAINSPEPKTEIEYEKRDITAIADDYAVVYDQINIAGNNIPIFYSSDTRIDAGNEVGLYGNYFLYGHNTSHVFGRLQYLGIGDRFTVTLDGITRTYEIVNSDTQEKSYFEGSFYRQKKMPGTIVFEPVRIMNAITKSGEYQGRYYDYILMTCAGTSYGNGDASHRLILMANEV